MYQHLYQVFRISLLSSLNLSKIISESLVSGMSGRSESVLNESDLYMAVHERLTITNYEGPHEGS